MEPNMQIIVWTIVWIIATIGVVSLMVGAIAFIFSMVKKIEKEREEEKKKEDERDRLKSEPTKEPEGYKCPHCKSRKNTFFAVDGDIGGPSWNTYKCQCGRIFDEPYNGDIGLSRGT